MEVIDLNVGLLTNFEVFEFLQRDNRFPTYTDLTEQLQQQQLTEVEQRKQLNENTRGISQHTTTKTTQKPKVQQEDDYWAIGLEAETNDTDATPADPSVSTINHHHRSYDQLKQLEQTAWVKQATLHYLTQTPTAVQTSENMSACLHAISKWMNEQKIGLSLIEIQSLLNWQPRTDIDLHCYIEECDERMTKEQEVELLAIITEHLPEAEMFPVTEPPEEPAADEAMQDESAATHQLAEQTTNGADGNGTAQATQAAGASGASAAAPVLPKLQNKRYEFKEPE